MTASESTSDGPLGLDHLFAEIRAAVSNGMWLTALMSTLALPDICAALGSSNGQNSRHKYQLWWDANLKSKYPHVDAKEFYKLRCSMLHQGGTKADTYSRILFAAGGPGTVMHNNFIEDALNFDLPTLADDVIAAADSWLTATRENEPVKSNLTKMIRWYPQGLPPYIGGVPVLS